MDKQNSNYRLVEIDQEEIAKWNIPASEAVEIQKRLAPKVVLCSLPHRTQWIGAADVSYSKNGKHLFAAVIVCHLPGYSVVERVVAFAQVKFPYIPGLLSFRETPLLVEVFKHIEKKPEIIICDGQGLAHTRRFGLACHLGFLLNIPTIGCAKTKLVGDHKDVGPRKGQYRSLYYRGERVGVVLRTRTGVKPIYVSPGHLSDITSSVRLVLRCCNKYRIPEPVRQAHFLANEVRCDMGETG